MVKRRLKRCRACNKVRYPSQVFAEDVAAWRMFRAPGYVISVYKCPAGNDWHITKTNQLGYIRRRDSGL